MVLTTSQNDAIKKQMKVFAECFSDATFDIKTRMKTLFLEASYTAPNATGESVEMKAIWQIGRRGKVTRL